MQIYILCSLCSVQTCAYLHPPCPLCTCSFYFVDSCRSPNLSLTHFKENPHPSKSAILLGAYVWLIGCGLIPSLLQPVPIVSHSQRAACGWRTDWLSKVNAWHGCMGWGCILLPSLTIIHLQFPAAICILLWVVEKGARERRGGRVLVTLGCLFNSWGS